MERKAFTRSADSFKLQGTMLLNFWKRGNKWRRVYLESEAAEKKAHLEVIHKRGHCGNAATRKAAIEEIYPIHYTEIMTVVGDCPVCKHKGTRGKKKPKKTIIENEPGQRYQADLIDLSAYADRNDGY
ncbi:MAG: uncharacterized protein A8A55_3447, partial [Amphiamblys sp. WSBS2006]